MGHNSQAGASWEHALGDTLAAQDNTTGRWRREQLLIDTTTQLQGMTTAQQISRLATYENMRSARTYPALIRVPESLRRMNGGLLIAPLLTPGVLIGPIYTYAALYPRIPMQFGRRIIVATSCDHRTGVVRGVGARSPRAFSRDAVFPVEFTVGEILPVDADWRVYELPSRWPRDAVSRCPIKLRRLTHERPIGD